jgi:hypothetical protein
MTGLLFINTLSRGRPKKSRVRALSIIFYESEPASGAGAAIRPQLDELRLDPMKARNGPAEA